MKLTGSDAFLLAAAFALVFVVPRYLEPNPGPDPEPEDEDVRPDPATDWIGELYETERQRRADLMQVVQDGWDSGNPAFKSDTDVRDRYNEDFHAMRADVWRPLLERQAQAMADRDLTPLINEMRQAP